ncbi:MAG TPA: TonB-dependent receptor, partial [Kineobactrum sp.]
MQRVVMAVAVAAAIHSFNASAQQLEEVTILGSREAVRTLPGSGALIDSDQIRIEAANDINQLLKTVPGVYIQEEDGYGLRPNIGIRGATSERASKITLLEDGIMMAPAPYSNPAAYYFPTASRMSSVEVLKGAPLLRHGPQTTGGVVNLVSTPIPEERAGRLNLRAGQDGETDLLASYGARSGDFGFLVETAQRNSDGFKDIDRSSRDSGFDIEDYVVKLGWETQSQSLLLKAQYSEEISDETYLGLTDVDFARDANRRYGLSSIDQMTNDHQAYSLTYRYQLSAAARATVTAYHNSFARDWFKLSGGGALISAANNGDAFAQGVLDGTEDVSGLQYKHNNREYTSQGVELNLDIALGNHQLAIGGRRHQDDMDRYQPSEIYDQINGELVWVGERLPTGGDNRFEQADALTFWAVDSWQVNDAFNVNLALRYEDVESSRRQYSTVDRNAAAPSIRGNDNHEWLPGASFTYALTSNWQVLAGVHRGFSPLGGGAAENEDPETSVNWEAGLRYNGGWFVEAVGFYSEFDNKTENCSNANPCSNGDTSGAFVTGEAVIAGLELQAGTELALGSFTVPVDLMYTYTDAAISKDNQALGFNDGDRLASVPENIFSLRMGLETPMGWDNYAVVKYTDELCMTIGCNNGSELFNRSEDLWVLDLVSRYAVSDTATAYFKLENALDEQVIVSRQ